MGPHPAALLHSGADLRGCYTPPMSSPLLLAALVLSSTTAPSAPSASTTAPPSAPSAEAVPPVPAASAPAPGASRTSVGVGLLSAGTAIAAGSTVAFTLATVLSTPDRETATPTAAEENLASVGGFVGAAIFGVSAVLVVVGAGLTLSESSAHGEPVAAPAPPSAS